MILDKQSGVSHNAMSGTPSEQQQQPTALVYQDLYCFFLAGTHTDKIEEKLSILLCPSGGSSSLHSDSDRLREFRLLKSRVEEQHKDKFQLILESDRTKGSWRYEFRIGETHSYKSEAKVIGEGADLSQYENEYFCQAFLARDAKFVTDRVDFLRQDPIQGAMAALHLGHFLNLITRAPQRNENRFEIHLDFDRTNPKQTWTYGFSINGVSFYQSKEMSALFADRQISAFQRYVTRDRFLQILKPENSNPEASPYLAKLAKPMLNVDNDSLGIDADQAKIFELMASAATIYKKKSAIELGRKEFTLTLDGKALFQGDIPEAKEGQYFTPRVQITMSALRVALFPLQRAFAEIMKSFDKYRLGTQGVAAQGKLTLIEALKDNPEGLREIKVKPTISAIGNTSSYDLKAVFDNGKKPTFSVIESSAISRVLSAFLSKSSPGSGAAAPLALENKQSVLKALCVSMNEKIYAKSVVSMTDPEKAVLHWQMHKTPFGDFTLGEVLDVPKPDGAPASDKSGKLVQDF